MLKKILKNLVPEKSLQEDTNLHIFGEFIHDRNLWHMNRRSVAGAVAVGLFCAFIPVPMQMLIAAGLAIIFRVNLPIAVVCVWVTNPLTMPALFFIAYKVGTWLTSTQLGPFEFEFSLNWLFTELRERWKPFLAGCLFVGASSGVLGYIAARVFWRLYVVSFWRKRKFRKRANKL